MTSFFDRTFGKRQLVDEEKRIDFITTLFADRALFVLMDASRQHENDWTDRTRYTVIGYLSGATIESLPSSSRSELDHAIFLAYQKLCFSLMLKEEFLALIETLNISKNEYFLAGFAGAVHDHAAIRNRQVAIGFFEALQFLKNHL